MIVFQLRLSLVAKNLGLGLKCVGLGLGLEAVSLESKSGKGSNQTWRKRTAHRHHHRHQQHKQQRNREKTYCNLQGGPEMTLLGVHFFKTPKSSCTISGFASRYDYDTVALFYLAPSCRTVRWCNRKHIRDTSRLVFCTGVV